MADSMNTHTGIPSVHNGFWRIADKKKCSEDMKVQDWTAMKTGHSAPQWWNGLVNIVNGTEDVGTEEMGECTQ